MADVTTQFEIQDIKGSTKHYASSVGTSPTLLPASADKIITSIFLENIITNSPATRELSFSFDGGTSYTALRVGESIIWSPKGEIKQIYIQANAGTINYNAIINFEEY